MSSHADQQKAKRLYEVDQLSLRKIGRRLGISHEGARRMLLEAGVKLRPRSPGEAPPKPTELAPPAGVTEAGWTEARTERLKGLWLSGKSASEIARDLGGVTRNAVLAKVDRLGLSERRAPPAEPRPIAAAPAAPPAPLKRHSPPLAELPQVQRSRANRTPRQLLPIQPEPPRTDSRIKPVTPNMVRWTRAYVARGVAVAYMAELFGVPADSLRLAIGGLAA